jgi:hypothetical protein
MAGIGRPAEKADFAGQGSLTAAWLGSVRKEAMERLRSESGGSERLEQYFNELIE